MSEEQIQFFSEYKDFELDQQELYRSWVKVVIHKHNKSCGALNYIFCSDDYLLDINRQYLDHDYYTDIISFPDEDSDSIAGDLYISIDRVRDNAQQLQVPFSAELDRVIIHGVLHFLGFSDKTEQEEKEMRVLEDKMVAIKSKLEV